MRRHAASVSVRLHYRKRQPHITLSALMPCTSLCHMQTTATAADINLFFRDKYLGRSRECHFVYAHVRSNRSPRRWTVSRQNIDDSRWKPSLSKQYRRKQSLAEITTEPSKTASGVRESGPNPRSLPAENRGNIKKKKVSKTRQWKRRQKEEGVGANTAFSIEIESCDHSLLSQLFLMISSKMFCYSSSEFQHYFKIWPFSKGAQARDSDN